MFFITKSITKPKADFLYDKEIGFFFIKFYLAYYVKMAFQGSYYFF
ncbi:hypothetical protein BACI71_70652 [Bacillus mycoides]|uniref:Uncharacterized protein n=1 Tax=Bacillus mycoides TaxID=1405 RepID=A0A654BQL7_BACMY|nr:hypothetical protein BACI71_70652 [Bacillus mycoides]